MVQSMSNEQILINIARRNGFYDGVMKTVEALVQSAERYRIFAPDDLNGSNASKWIRDRIYEHLALWEKENAQ